MPIFGSNIAQHLAINVTVAGSASKIRKSQLQVNTPHLQANSDCSISNIINDYSTNPTTCQLLRGLIPDAWMRIGFFGLGSYLDSSRHA
jgi:hypothetical protein